MKKPLAFLAVLILSGCHSAPTRAGSDGAPSFKGPRPEWVDGPSSEYNHDAYITGVGMADDRQSAEDRSRGEIAKIFSTVVDVKTDQTESESNTSGTGKGSENKFQQSITQKVQTAAKKALEGVEVVEKWQDPATRQHYALAVLNRAKAAEAVKERLAEADKQTAEYKKLLDESTEKLGRVKAALKLLTLLKSRGDLAAELRVITGKGAEAGPVDEAVVRPQAAKAVSELNVAVDMTGEASQQIETGIVAGLNGFGLQAKVGKPGEADVSVDGLVKTQAQRAAADDKWKWARATVTVALKEKSGKTFARFDLTSRQASADQSEANRRAHVELAKKVSASVKDSITDYFENQ